MRYVPARVEQNIYRPIVEPCLLWPRSRTYWTSPQQNHRHQSRQHLQFKDLLALLSSQMATLALLWVPEVSQWYLEDKLIKKDLKDLKDKPITPHNLDKQMDNMTSLKPLLFTRTAHMTKTL